MATSPPLAVLLLVLVLGQSIEAQLLHCEIVCPPPTTVTVRTDDPFNCLKYYECYSDGSQSTFSYDCPIGMAFDTYTKECMDPSNPGFSCTIPCQKCTFDCQFDILAKASDATDCSVYYECLGGGVNEIHQCESSAPHFDGNTCQTDPEKCCSCLPVCTSNDATNHAVIPDYTDCTCFYECTVEGFAQNHGCCPAGEIFVPTLGRCDLGAPCEEPCAAVATGHCTQAHECLEVGFFPKCNNLCDPHYFECSWETISKTVFPQPCTVGNVFDPNQGRCVHPEDCSFYVK